MPHEGLDHHYGLLQAVLSELQPSHRVAFAASCAQVLLRNYHAFVKESGWGDPEVLERRIAAAWQCSIGARPPSLAVSELIRQCKAVAPDTERFEQASTSAALNAVSAAVGALSTCAGSSTRNAVNAATACIDTVWGYVQVRDDMDPNDPQLEAQILRDPLMTQELVRQERLLESLRGLRSIDSSSVAEVRQSSMPLRVRFE
jgi:uncharacterized protein